MKKILHTLTILLALLMLAERLWKHIIVIRFFRRPIPSASSFTSDISPQLVSILQPILSGDPTLARCLERNLQARTSYPREFVWLVDTDDAEGQRTCRELIARYPTQDIQLFCIISMFRGGKEKPTIWLKPCGSDRDGYHGERKRWDKTWTPHVNRTLDIWYRSLLKKARGDKAQVTVCQEAAKGTS